MVKIDVHIISIIKTVKFEEKINRNVRVSRATTVPNKQYDAQKWSPLSMNQFGTTKIA